MAWAVLHYALLFVALLTCPRQRVHVSAQNATALDCSVHEAQVQEGLVPYVNEDAEHCNDWHWTHISVPFAFCQNNYCQLSQSAVAYSCCANRLAGLCLPRCVVHHFADLCTRPSATCWFACPRHCLFVPWLHTRVAVSAYFQSDTCSCELVLSRVYVAVKTSHVYA